MTEIAGLSVLMALGTGMGPTGDGSAPPPRRLPYSKHGYGKNREAYPRSKMINDVAPGSDRADTAKPPLITTVSRPRQRSPRPTVVDDAPPDWEWEDWAARFWASEPHARTDDDAPGDGR